MNNSNLPKNFKQVCKKLDIDHDKLLSGFCLARFKKTVIAYQKLCLVVECLNSGWAPDWSNENQYKYIPYFEWNEKSCGFSFSYVDFQYTNSGAASSLYFSSEKLAQHAAKYFLDIYKDWLETDESNKHSREIMLELENSL